MRVDRLGCSKDTYDAARRWCKSQGERRLMQFRLLCSEIADAQERYYRELAPQDGRYDYPALRLDTYAGQPMGTCRTCCNRLRVWSDYMDEGPSGDREIRDFVRMHRDCGHSDSPRGWDG